MQTIGRVLDNDGKTFDRYSIEFQCEDGSSYWISSGPTGNVPNGVFMSLDFEPSGRIIQFSDLPERVQQDAHKEAKLNFGS